MHSLHCHNNNNSKITFRTQSTQLYSVFFFAYKDTLFFITCTQWWWDNLSIVIVGVRNFFLFYLFHNFHPKQYVRICSSKISIMKHFVLFKRYDGQLLMNCNLMNYFDMCVVIKNYYWINKFCLAKKYSFSPKKFKTHCVI